MILVFIIGWFICAGISASIFLAYMQARFNLIANETYRQDLSLSWYLGLCLGPLCNDQLKNTYLQYK
jgi:hypothetical protein